MKAAKSGNHALSFLEEFAIINCRVRHFGNLFVVSAFDKNTVTEENEMLLMPDGEILVNEMTVNLPLICYSNKRNTKHLATQGVRLSDKTRLEVISVHNLYEAGGVMCAIKYGESGEEVLIVSISGLDFRGNGSIDDKIGEYKEARIEWLKKEERRNMGQMLEEIPKTGRNAICPCGSGKKYKRCCGG